MENKLKCPKCGGENVVTDDTYNTAYDGDKIVYSVCGHCGSCGTNLQWEEIYCLVGFTDICVDEETSNG